MKAFPLLVKYMIYNNFLVLNSLSDLKMDVAVPHSTGRERALDVEECACPQGYRGPSCQVLIL